MSTHYSRCVVCNKRTMCSGDEHALGCGRDCCCGEHPELAIEFCSLDCFLELFASMKERARIASEVVPEWSARISGQMGGNVEAMTLALRHRQEEELPRTGDDAPEDAFVAGWRAATESMA